MPQQKCACWFCLIYATCNCVNAAGEVQLITLLCCDVNLNRDCLRRVVLALQHRNAALSVIKVW